MFLIKREGAFRTRELLLKGGRTCSTSTSALGGLTGEHTGDCSVLGDIAGERSSSTGSIGAVMVIGGSLVAVR